MPAREIVPGDLVNSLLVGIVPADVRSISGNVLLDQVDDHRRNPCRPKRARAGRPSPALVKRGEAEAVVTATGARTYSGRAAELVRIAHGPSAEQATILRVVRNLALFNGCVLLLMIGYAIAHDMPAAHLVALDLTVILESVPVALPATFTLAARSAPRSA